MLKLEWKESIFNLLFFKSMSARGIPGKIEIATAFSGRLRLLGFRAGYPRPLIIHNFRAEGLYWIDLYTTFLLKLGV